MNGKTQLKKIILIGTVIFISLLLLFIQHFNQKEEHQILQINTSEWNYDNPSTLMYPHDRFKAAFITFVKNDTISLTKLRYTMRNLEDQFNKNHNYPYLIFTDQDLSQEYMELVASLSKATVKFEKVGKDLYGYHPKTDLERAAQARIDMSQMVFGESEDYRFQSRFMAGMIYR
jgi:alpha 1,2-mannosyltransferase